MTLLTVGDKAPAFTGRDQDGVVVSLSDYLGQRVILYFYPKDNTAGCTAEACSLRDGEAELQRQGFTILGVSPDSEKSHQNFRAKYTLPFHLISDPAHEIATCYEAWGTKKFMGRTYNGILRKTFIIDSEGKIEKIFEKVNTKNHFRQIVDSYQ